MGSVLAKKKLRAVKLPLTPCSTKELQYENPWGLAQPLHFLVGSGNARKVSRGVVSHVVTTSFPDGSFIRVDKNLIVSSPELCFVQMAGILSLAELVALGYEFCGGYRLDKEDEKERGFRDDPPLTSVVSLHSYVGKAVGMVGRKKAIQALRFIADGSRSPMETALAILLTFPYRLGGYGFPVPLLNYPIEVPAGTRRAHGTTELYSDLYWKEEKVDVEYDSDAYHAHPTQLSRDAARRNSLSSAGVTVITVTWGQVVYPTRLREVAEALSKLLNKRLQLSRLDFAVHHAKLCSQVLPRTSSGWQ